MTGANLTEIATMANAKTELKDLDWQEVDPDTLEPEVAAAYAKYKAHYATAKESREEFEELATLVGGVPETHRLVFSYRFGKLNMAVDKALPAKKASAKAKSFTDAVKIA